MKIFDWLFKKKKHCYDEFMKACLYYKSPSVNVVERAVRECDAQPWYIYSFEDFYERKHAYLPYKWIIRNVNKSAKILEVACGAGGMLPFLYPRGYKNLYGYDNDSKSIEAAKMINEAMKYKIHYLISDAFNPNLCFDGDKIKEKFDVIIWVNGMYHVPGYRLEYFIRNHKDYLDKNGVFIIDMVDSKYNLVENNQYRTSDWGKPVNERRESEYYLRMSKDEIQKVLKDEKFELIFYNEIDDIIPRNIAIFKRIQ